LQKELEVLFDVQNTSRNGGITIPATFLGRLGGGVKSP